jgi:hypothetical protein
VTKIAARVTPIVKVCRKNLARPTVHPDELSAVAMHDLVVGYRTDIGVSVSMSRGCRRTGGADIRRANTAQALLLADALRLEYRSWRIVHYPGGGYSAAAQERCEYRGDEQQFACHVVFPISIFERFGRSPFRRTTEFK